MREHAGLELDKQRKKNSDGRHSISPGPEKMKLAVFAVAESGKGCSSKQDLRMNAILGRAICSFDCQRPAHDGGLFLDDSQVGPRSRIGLPPTLFPFPQGTIAQAICTGKFGRGHLGTCLRIALTSIGFGQTCSNPTLPR